MMYRPASFVAFRVACLSCAGALSTIAAAGCTAPSACAAECQTREPACPGCPAIAQELCVDGACVARDADKVDVEATVNIDRDLVGVQSLRLLVVDARGATCGASADAAVLDGRVVTVSGGTFHPDLTFGRAPEGAVLVVAEANASIDGDGDTLGVGCLAADAVAPKLDVDVLDVQ